MADTIQVYGQTFSDVTGVKLTDDNNQQIRLVKPAGTISISSNGTVDVAAYESATVSVSAPSGTMSISANGTYDVTSFASADVAVPQPSGSTSINISANGTTSHNVSAFETAQIITNVPNTYSASDEGKVVQSGALVSQGSSTFSINDTYDTTYLNSITVAVSGQSGITVGPLSVSANGTYTAPSGAAYSPVTVAVQPLQEKDVNFYDYDGTLVDSYTKTEFLALSAMPANPSHTGLTAQGWNWTLSDAQTWVTNYDGCCIGQHYITDDLCTRIYVTVATAGQYNLPYNVSASGFSIDWGDSSTAESLATGSNTLQHQYQAGTYIIKIQHALNQGVPEQIKLGIISGSITDWSDQILSLCNKIESANIWLCNMELRCLETISSTKLDVIEGSFRKPFKNAFKLKCYISSTATDLWDESFLNCGSLEVFSTVNCTNVNQYSFIGCCSLKDSVMYNFANATFTNRGTRDEDGLFLNCSQIRHCSNIPTVTFKNAFKYCLNLERITFSSSCTRIGSYQFYGCHNLKDIVFPASLTKLEMFAFGYCLSLGTLDFRAATEVPTLDPLVFNYTNDTYTIVVPDALYNDWIAASNWSSISSHIISASDYANL